MNIHAGKKKKKVSANSCRRKEKVLSFDASGPIIVDPSRVVVEKNKLNGLFAVESGGKTSGPRFFSVILACRIVYRNGRGKQGIVKKKRKKKKKKINV